MPSKQTDLSGHILKAWILPKTLQVEEAAKTFTTEPKRKRRRTTIRISKRHSVVREKCRQLTRMCAELFPNGIIPNEDLVWLVSNHCGGNRGTIRAYMGYAGIVKRSKQSGEGYIVGRPRKGYLELFNFMAKANSESWKINGYWMKTRQDKFPLSSSPPPNINELLESRVAHDSKENFSLSPVETVNRVQPSADGVRNKINNNNTVREIFFRHGIRNRIREEKQE